DDFLVLGVGGDAAFYACHGDASLRVIMNLGLNEAWAQRAYGMYFLTILASLSLRTMVPRASRMNFACRLIIPWRLPWAAALTLPVPVILKRFLAPLLVFNLGILLSSIHPRTPLARACQRGAFEA